MMSGGGGGGPPPQFVMSGIPMPYQGGPPQHGLPPPGLGNPQPQPGTTVQGGPVPYGHPPGLPPAAYMNMMPQGIGA